MAPGQQHLDRLSAVDAAFLHQEGASTHMHIGALALFDGSAPSHVELLEHIRDRLHLVPRYRQRIATARPTPISLICGIPVPAKIANTATMISAALEIVFALAARPWATAERFSRVTW